MSSRQTPARLSPASGWEGSQSWRKATDRLPLLFKPIFLGQNYKTMTASEIRTKYLEFMQSKGHTVIPRANLVPQDDPTTLFTGSGMQPLVPYLLGAVHPEGNRLANSQTCFRAEDIDEVGDNRHTTFFEMLGNWSLGDYFKKEELQWFWEFLTGAVGLDPQKLYVTAYVGDEKYKIPEDKESVELWEKLFERKGIEAAVARIGSEANGYRRGMKPGERIFLYDGKKNWWNRGEKGPGTTPVGDPCGPNSEVFFEFSHIEHDQKWGEHCHPNCDCGRFVEVGNAVFMEYRKREDGVLDRLPKFNVDFGGGLERMAAAEEGSGDIFKISLLWPIVEKLEHLSGKKYDEEQFAMRVIADHLRGAAFLVGDGVLPSNKEQGYVLRRFVRRAIRQALTLDLKADLFEQVVPVVLETLEDAYPELVERKDQIIQALVKEEKIFRQTLERGVREFKKLAGDKLTGETVFKLFDTYGFPAELSLEEAKSQGVVLGEDWRQDFDRLMIEQKARSRTATKGEFKGGLADNSEITTKYHTATHIMYRALREVLGDDVVQRGANITAERIRFDFSHPEKVTPDQIQQVEEIVNQKIADDLPVKWEEFATKDALAKGAYGAFGDRYGERVKVYSIGEDDGRYSFEICGGPHVERTGQIGEGGKQFKIVKEESSSAGVRRIKAVLK